ncbi:DUF3099 domain-containing protein [Streptomyces sp. NPDC004008]
MRKLHSGEQTQVYRITGARQGLAADVRGRQRRYVISMSIRTVAVILAATLWNVERPFAVVALVLGAVLPYVAVVVANAGRENAPSLPSSFLNVPVRPMITPPDAGQHTESVPEEEPAEPSADAREEPRERA